MARHNKTKPQLPKSVLDMKFMKKTKDRMEKELANKQGHNELYANIITNEMLHASGNFITESSFIYCDELMDGRLSFKGMNPEIEQIMASEDLQDAQPTAEMQKDVSDEILAKTMKALKRSRDPSPTKYSFKRKNK